MKKITIDTTVRITVVSIQAAEDAATEDEMEDLPIMKKQPAGFRGQYADEDYLYRETSNATKAEPTSFRYPMLGCFVDTYSIPESSMGTCEILGQGWFACIWGNRRGPFDTRSEAEESLHAMLQQNRDVLPMMSEPSRRTAAVIAVIVGFALLAWLIYEAIQIWG